jgi:hypothetical protein
MLLELAIVNITFGFKPLATKSGVSEMTSGAGIACGAIEASAAQTAAAIAGRCGMFVGFMGDYLTYCLT